MVMDGWRTPKLNAISATRASLAHYVVGDLTLYPKGAGVSGTELDPLLKLGLCTDEFRSDSQRSLHWTVTHHCKLSGGLVHDLIRLVGINSDQDTTLHTGCDGHVAADEECKSPEYLFLSQAALPASSARNRSARSSSYATTQSYK